MCNRSFISLLSMLFALILSACGGGNSTSTPPASTYTVGGTVTGLTSGTLVLKNNGGDSLTVSANSSTFTFATALATGTAYAVTVGTQPSGLSCTVSNGTGTIASANIINVSVSCKLPFAYVVNATDKTVSMFSIGNNGVLVPLSTPTVATGNNPNGIAITPAGTFAYVANSDDSTVSMYSVGSNGVLAPLSTPTVSTGPNTPPLGSSPVRIAINSAGTYAYVTNARGNTVAMYSIGSNGVLAPLSTPSVATGSFPWGIAINPAGTYAYVANASSGTVSMYSIGSNGVLAPLSTRSVKAGTFAVDVTINPAGTYAYVPNVGVSLEDGSVSMYSIGSNGVLAPLSTPSVVVNTPIAVGINSAGTYAYVVSRGGNVFMYSIGSNGVLAPLSTPTVAAGRNPISIAITP